MQQGLAARAQYVDFNSHNSTDILILTVKILTLIILVFQGFVLRRLINYKKVLWEWHCYICHIIIFNFSMILIGINIIKKHLVIKRRKKHLIILHKLVHVSVKFFVYGRKREFFFIHFRNQMLQQAFKTHDNLSDCLIYICLHICIIIKPIHTRLFYPE